MIGDVLSWVIGVVVLGAVTALINREAVGQCSRLARRCIDRVTAGMPEEDRARWAEELTSVLDAKAGPLSELYEALSLLRRAEAIQSETWRARGRERPFVPAAPLPTRLRGWLAWSAAGADREIFGMVGRLDQQRLLALGLTQLVAVGIAGALAGGLMVAVGISGPALAIPLGTIWGLLLMVLDRSLLGGRPTTGVRRWARHISVLLLDVAGGLMASESLLLIIFDGELLVSGDGPTAPALSAWERLDIIHSSQGPFVLIIQLTMCTIFAAPVLMRLLGGRSHYDALIERKFQVLLGNLGDAADQTA